MERLPIGAAVLPFGAAVGGLAFDDVALAAEGTGLADERVLRLGLLLWRTLFWQSLNSFVRRSFARFLQIFVGQYGDAAVRRVGHHFVDNLGDLGFQLFYELLCVVLLVLDVAELLLPDARQFAAFQEFLADEVDEFYARRCGDEALAVAAYVVALEERRRVSSSTNLPAVSMARRREASL